MNKPTAAAEASSRASPSDHHDEPTAVQRVVQRAYRAGCRGAAIGFALRGGLHAVSMAVQVARGQKLSHRPRDQAWDSLRWAAALAAFGSVYVTADESIRSTVGCHRCASSSPPELHAQNNTLLHLRHTTPHSRACRSAHWRAAAAGAIAGPAILLTGARTRHDELALYFLLRGLTLLVRCGNKAPPGGALHAALAPTRWRHGDVAMMCAATWQILFAYIMVPQSLPGSYIRFLDRMAGFQSWLVPVVRVRAPLCQAPSPCTCL